MPRVSTSSWGIRYPALKILYRGTFVATITYAAACWAERASLHVVRSVLVRAQRLSLILLTKAYRTTSSAALAVLAGVLPADLEVIRAARLDDARRTAPKEELAGRKRVIGLDVVAKWQARWTEDDAGGDVTRRFFPSVSGRLEATWVSPDYETSQILTGHGCFRARLHGLQLCESSSCECGDSNEDLHHVLWYCPLYEDIREELLRGIVKSEPGPVYYQDLVSSADHFSRLRGFAHAWHRRRKLTDGRTFDYATADAMEDDEDTLREHVEGPVRTRLASVVSCASAPERGEGPTGTRT